MIIPEDKEATLSPDARRLLHLLEAHHVGPANAITQLRAGRALGMEGSIDSIRRRVQKLKDELHEAGHRVICRSSGKPMGMYMAQTEAQWQRYLDEIQGRAVSSMQTLLALAPERRGRLHAAITRVPTRTTTSEQADLFGGFAA